MKWIRRNDNKNKNVIINSSIIAAITAIRHTDTLVICDPGLPIPAYTNVIDISLAEGIPAFVETLKLIYGEMAVEGAVIASEMPEKSQGLYKEVSRVLEEIPVDQVSHEEFKEMTNKAKFFIITGETTPYANVILVGGVSF